MEPSESHFEWILGALLVVACVLAYPAVRTAMKLMRERVVPAMQEPVSWKPDAEAPASLNATATVRALQQIRTIEAYNEAGARFDILEIVPLEPVQAYDRVRMERGRPRYELKDGTPVTRHSDTCFEVAHTNVRLNTHS